MKNLKQDLPALLQPKNFTFLFIVNTAGNMQFVVRVQPYGAAEDKITNYVFSDQYDFIESFPGKIYGNMDILYQKKVTHLNVNSIVDDLEGMANDNDRISWEQDVCYEMEVQGEMTTSDAQGIMMIQEIFIDNLYKQKIDAQMSAAMILTNSLSKNN